MTIKERVKTIQDTIDQLQADISEIDQKFKYYKILIHDLCANPMEIRLFRHREDGSDVLVDSALVNFLDSYVEDNLKDCFLKAEFDYCEKKNVLPEQLIELNKIKKLFGL